LEIIITKHYNILCQLSNFYIAALALKYSRTDVMKSVIPLTS
jgi:hypothetical protein